MDKQTAHCDTTPETLAITSVPIQKRTKVYFPDTALKEGTIFPELNLPFFVTDPLSSTASTCNCEKCECIDANKMYDHLFTDQHFEREEVMKALYEISFFLNDMLLYLDTHPDDQEAIDIFNVYNADRKKLLQRMEVDFYPLSPNCIVDARGNEDHFSWTDGALPWEGACL